MLSPVPPAQERIDDILRRQARDRPTATALLQDQRRLSFGQLDQLTDAAAERLAAQGLRAGDRLLLVMENDIAAVIALFAAARLRAWTVLANARLSAPELAGLQRHCDARLVLYVSAASPEAAQHARDAGAEEADWGEGLGRLHLGRLNTACRPEPAAAHPRDEVAVLLYTTGTTSRPKGVMLSHGNLLFVAAGDAGNRRLAASDHIYMTLPMSHVYGLAAVCLGALHAGATLQLNARFDAGQLLQALARQDVSVFHGVPAMFVKLCELATSDGAPPPAPRLRWLYCGGAPLSLELKQKVETLFRLPLHHGYGLTESSPTICRTLNSAPRADCSVGPPIAGIEVQLVKASGQLADLGETGEIWVRGPNVMRGYYRDPELTAQTVDVQGWLHTGDLARREADGALFIVGRSKELIIRSGFNVHPQEIEQALNSHPAIRQSAVIGQAREDNEDIIAYVELKPDCQASVAELSAFLRQRLAAYKCPSAIHLLPALPASATGKILKAKLRGLVHE